MVTRNQKHIYKSLEHLVYEQCFSTDKLYLLAILNVIQHTEVLILLPRGALELEGFYSPPPPFVLWGILFFNQTSNDLCDTLEVKVPQARNQLGFL